MNFLISWKMFGACRAGHAVFLGVCALLLALQHAPAQNTNVSKEYEIKATFLFHFAQFVEWPRDSTNSDSTNSDSFRIGVLGDNPFGEALNQLVKGGCVHGRRLVVEYSRSADRLKNCQIVFINRKERHRMPDILKKLNGRPVLTVSDYDGFAQRGGVINFYLHNGRVHFEINPDAAKRAGLKISSQLMRLGKIVQSAP